MTGDITALKETHGGRWKAGRVIQTKSTSGYIRFSFLGVAMLGHQVAWALHHGEWASANIDHADGNPSNNRLENLRVASHAQNMQNIAGFPERRKSQFKGVYFHKSLGYWVASIEANTKKIVRYRKTEREAAEEYLFLALENHGEFARAA